VTAGQPGIPNAAGYRPAGDIELLAEASGLLMGRLLLSPGDGRPTVEQRLVAVGPACGVPNPCDRA
jgi:hypothetical protein